MMRGWVVCAVVAVVGCAGRGSSAPEASDESSGQERASSTTEAPVAAGTPVVENPDQFESVTAGFSLRKPTQWHFASLEQIADNRAQVRLRDEVLQEAIKNQAHTPLVALMKHEEPYPEFNPSVQVIVRPLGQLKALPPTKLLEVSIGVAQAVSDFQLIEPISETQLSGLPAASLRARYVLATQDGTQFATLTCMWLAIRGEFMFLVSMSGPPEGDDVSEAEFAEVLASIQIDT